MTTPSKEIRTRKGPVPYARLWLKAFMQIVCWRIAMICMFYFFSAKSKQA